MGSNEAAQGPNELPADVKAKVTETHQAFVLVLSSSLSSLSCMTFKLVLMFNRVFYSLMLTRKKRKAPPGYATPEAVSAYVETLSIPSMHASKPAGVSALDVSADGNLILTGGNDKIVQIYDRTTSKAVATLKGHTKKVNHVSFREQEGSKSVAVSAGADGKVQIFGEDEGKWSSAHKIAASKQEITGLALHPTKSYVASSSADSTCALYDLESGSIVQTYEPLSSGEGSYAYTSVAIHPDGLLLGGGTVDGTVRIFDIRDKSSLAANLSNESGSPIPSLSFSENGYHLAVANSANSSIGIFDLRKLSLLHSISLPTASAPGGGKISSLRFDTSGQFLACAGTDLRVFKNKTWEECLAFEGNTAELSDVRFGPLGREIVLSGADRTVRVLSAPTTEA
jgi:pre-mRNA-processing factor 19